MKIPNIISFLSSAPQNILYQGAKMGALKPLSFELGYFMIGILLVSTTKRKKWKSIHFVVKRFENMGQIWDRLALL